MSAEPWQSARCVTASGMRGIEAAAMASGVGEAELMELAGVRLGHALAAFFPVPGTAVGWVGKGHNGGDALIALGVLRDCYGWRIRLRRVFGEQEMAPLARARLADHADTPEFDAAEPGCGRGALVCIDGLLGIGCDGSPLRGPLEAAAAEMNGLRSRRGAVVAAVDLPSGIHPDHGGFPDNAVRADVTFTIGAVKSGLVNPAAANAVGAISLVSLAELRAKSGTGPVMICPQYPCADPPARPFDFHKGMAGRVDLLAGSEFYSGAAVLASGGALAAGAGLVTVHVPRAIHALVSAKCPPEVIVRPFGSLEEPAAATTDAWVVGCGLGDGWGTELVDFIAGTGVPTVVDADALNTLARHDAVEKLGTRHLATPHPGEFRRLAPEIAGLEPLEAAAAWADRSPTTLLLKGCRSVVAARGRDPLVNATGHPGMATAGQGDVLAGVAGALLAAGHPPPDAAALAAWLCGRAAERAIFHQAESAESLRAGLVITNLGPAFGDWRRATR